jgi:hypothetical protein
MLKRKERTINREKVKENKIKEKEATAGEEK